MDSKTIAIILSMDLPSMSIFNVYGGNKIPYDEQTSMPYSHAHTYMEYMGYGDAVTLSDLPDDLKSRSVTIGGP